VKRATTYATASQVEENQGKSAGKPKRSRASLALGGGARFFPITTPESTTCYFAESFFCFLPTQKKDASAAPTTTADVAAKRANKHLPKTTRTPDENARRPVHFPTKTELRNIPSGNVNPFVAMSAKQFLKQLYLLTILLIFIIIF